MSKESELNDLFFKGLRAISDQSFPKECRNCGRVYASPDDFFKQTSDVMGKTGLKDAYDDEEDANIVEVFRNCECGSTLMDVFGDRRDMTEKGEKRRALFDKLLNHLIPRGIEREVARLEILKLMKGGKSQLLEKHGISRNKTK